jgi:hypothetical protein
LTCALVLALAGADFVGLRETLNQNPAVTTGATIAIIALALAAIVWQLNGGGMSPAERGEPTSRPTAVVRSPK